MVRQKHMSKPNPPLSESPQKRTAQKSRGGLYLATGLLLLIVTGFLASFPGGYWEALLASFCFSLVGFLKAKGRMRRLAGLILTTTSGSLCVLDFLIWWSNRHL